MMYPLKAGQALTLTEAECTEWGLVHDRVLDRAFLVADAETGWIIFIPVSSQT